MFYDIIFKTFELKFNLHMIYPLSTILNAPYPPSDLLYA